jgi:hypothetical protein
LNFQHTSDYVLSNIPTCEDVVNPEDLVPGLSFGIPRARMQELLKLQNNLRKTERKVYWSHKYYRNSKGESVKVHYASNLQESENLAKRFLNEKVIGFDMEWMYSKYS